MDGNTQLQCTSALRRPKTSTPRPKSSILRPKSTVLQLDSGNYRSDSLSIPRTGFMSPRPHLTLMRPKSTIPRLESTVSFSPQLESTFSPRLQSAQVHRHIPLSSNAKHSRITFCTCASGRTRVRGNVVPGRVIPGEDRIHTSWNGQESSRQDYEFLINKWNLQGLQWIVCSGGQMPCRSVQGGHTRSGEPLYIARALTPDMTQCMGTFRPSTGKCHIPWRGREFTTSEYEILCHRSKLQHTSYLYTPMRPLSVKIQTLRNPFKVPA